MILNYSKVVWDINTKFSAVFVLIRFQLFAQFGSDGSKKRAATPLTISNFSRAWQAHFLSNTLQTWQSFFVFCRSTIDITITFGFMWLYRIWKIWNSFPLHMFRASWIIIEMVHCVYFIFLSKIASFHAYRVTKKNFYVGMY